MIWNYSLSTNTIWTSFDYGQVEADTYEQACELAIKKLKYDVEKANTALKHCDITDGFSIEMDYNQLEVKLADVQPQPEPTEPESQARQLTKFSQRNLLVIKNFLLYAGLEDDYTQTADDYISEDHVDGEGSPQAIREFALSCELIRESVEIGNSLADGYNIYYSEITGLIYAVSEEPNDPIFIYKLIKPQAEIEVEHRDEILDYCLAVKTKEDEVCLGDIFVHGKYVTLISEV